MLGFDQQEKSRKWQYARVEDVDSLFLRDASTPGPVEDTATHDGLVEDSVRHYVGGEHCPFYCDPTLLCPLRALLNTMVQWRTLPSPPLAPVDVPLLLDL
ncbi:hypothetical protein Q7C36_006716 [Tachysurus vachellii]|uniref:Uncharacterized protein n=1 Tax=Tachysurus vachellii TaxID=175792 RepID=A0AA88NES8_TACVA|nr:hypothetical protein Q7C36_006716 [Tachysurus vachellii]